MIRLEGVTKRYGGRILFQGFSLALATGKTTVITGRSGSGKSTLLRLFNQLERHDEGEVVLDELHMHLSRDGSAPHGSAIVLVVNNVDGSRFPQIPALNAQDVLRLHTVPHLACRTLARHGGEHWGWRPRPRRSDSAGQACVKTAGKCTRWPLFESSAVYCTLLRIRPSRLYCKIAMQLEYDEGCRQGAVFADPHCFGASPASARTQVH